jgi:cysteine synthase
MTIYADNSYSIGNTPLVRLKHFGHNGNVVVKIEGRNPSFSVKCRIGANMIWQAEKDGILTAGKEIVDATSGNTGIALAYVAAARGYLVLTEGSKGMKGAIAKAEEIVASNPNHYVMLKQFENPANPDIHRQTTGEEIWKDTEGKVDVVVAGVGTGGTITGISRAIKLDHGKKITSVAVEPTESPVISQTLAGQEVKPGPHKIQGIGAGFIPKNLDLSLIDRVETVDSDTAIATARRLMAEEGILAGISSGAAVAAADRLAKLPEFQDKLIVAILPSASERYLSTALFEGIEA